MCAGQTTHVIPIYLLNVSYVSPFCCCSVFFLYISIVLFSSDVLVHGKCFWSVRCNEWAQCSLTVPVWASIDLISSNNKVKFHSPICSAPLYHWHWIALFSGWIINLFYGPCFSKMFSGHKHRDYWLSLLVASSGKRQEEHWTVQHILCVKSGVCVSNKNRNPDAQMNTSRDGYRFD